MSHNQARQDTELLAQVVRFFPYGKLSTERVQYFIEHPAELTEALLSALCAVGQKVAGLFQILLLACHQDWVNDDITGEHFPLVDDGTGDKKIIEYGFDRTVTGHEAERELKKKGYKLVGMKRAMEYVAQNPDAQKAHPLIVLGAQWQNRDSVGVPCFFWSGGKRLFGLNWMSDVFSSSCRFLVVCE